MRSWTIIALLASLTVVALALTTEAIAKPQDAEEKTPPAEAHADKEDTEAKIRSLERKLAIANLRMVQTKLDNDGSESSAAASLRHAQEDLAIAQDQLAQYRDLDSKRQIEEARLSLQRTKDRAVEAAEELAQIELMYKDQDLDDRTAEFVIQRGKRNADRAAAQIELETMALTTLEKHEAPRELRQRTLDVSRKQSAVDAAQRELESARLRSQISLASGEADIAELRQELDSLRSKR